MSHLFNYKHFREASVPYTSKTNKHCPTPRWHGAASSSEVLVVLLLHLVFASTNGRPTSSMTLASTTDASSAGAKLGSAQSEKSKENDRFSQPHQSSWQHVALRLARGARGTSSRGGQQTWISACGTSGSKRRSRW